MRLRIRSLRLIALDSVQCRLWHCGGRRWHAIGTHPGAFGPRVLPGREPCSGGGGICHRRQRCFPCISPPPKRVDVRVLRRENLEMPVSVC